MISTGPYRRNISVFIKRSIVRAMCGSGFVDEVLCDIVAATLLGPLDNVLSLVVACSRVAEMSLITLQLAVIFAYHYYY